MTNPDRPDFKIVKVPMLDTGIGREAGYEDDAALIEAARKEREAMPPAIREAMERIEADLTRRFLIGDGC
jgi:hypothetical protein